MDSGELKRRFGKHVQGLRDAKGLTQEQLADRIGRSVDTVGNIERGVNATRIEVAYQIAKELDVGLSDLFAFDPTRIATAVPSRDAVAPILDMLADCDDETVRRLTDLMRVGLRLAGGAHR